ncbi:MAG TPA: Zn-ribbon domain-containing OB-fold protein [Acidimicrobiia bacterium]
MSADSVPVREGLFDDGHLLGGCCAACARHHFPSSARCPYCGSPDVTRVQLADHGTLWGWTAVTTPPPGYRGEVPFGFGVVELPEGLRLVTRLTEADPGRLTFGMPMRLVIDPLHTDDDGNRVATYAFAPAS